MNTLVLALKLCKIKCFAISHVLRFINKQFLPQCGKNELFHVLSHRQKVPLCNHIDTGGVAGGGGNVFYVPLKGHIFWPCKGWGRPCRAATLSRLDGMNSKLA